MTRRRFFPTLGLVLALMLGFLTPVQVASPERLIVRTAGLLDGLPIVRTACKLLGCRVLYRLDGTLGKLFLVELPLNVNVGSVIKLINVLPGILDAEVNQPVLTTSMVGTSAPSAIYDSEPLSYFGATVRGGYLRQPATGLIGLFDVQKQYQLTGKGITVAIIDTGVDATHPVLRPVLLPGYDFTRNRDGGSENSDVNQSTMAVLDGARPGWVNQSTMAVLDQSTMAVLDDRNYAAFGHGTMVAGIVHLVAPQATILPLKAFRADGSGYASDVLRAIYVAVRDNAKVINMSFSFQTSSRELERALDHANRYGIVAVAAAGNDGKEIDVYPAALGTVIGVASTSDADVLSSFSNYGPNNAWMASPGEGIVTTYPYGSWAAGWGTSFSAPFAAGTAALLAHVSMRLDGPSAALAEGEGVWFSYKVQKGRLQTLMAVRAWRARLGLR